MNCLNCGSQEIYRKNPQEKVVYCERCGYSWEVKQAKKPLLQTKVYMSRGPMRGSHYVSVWFCPMDISRYSFALNYGGGVCMFNEFSDDPYLSGSYETVEQALSAGIREVENDAR